MIFRIPIKARNDVYFSIATTKLPKLSKNPCKMFLNTKNASHMLKITTTYGEVHTCKVRASTSTTILYFKKFSLEIPKIENHFSKIEVQNRSL